MKPTAAEIDIGNVAQPQRQNAARQGERNAGKNQQTILDVAEHCKQQHEDQEQRHRDNDLQALCRRLQVLKGASPARPVPCVGILTCASAASRLRNEGTHIATTHVGTHHDATLAVLAADLIGPGGQLKLLLRPVE
jgi:hypothetical protein